jgi:20S proteasome alpha/beta subunit
MLRSVRDRSSIVKRNPYPLKHVVHFPQRKAVTIGIGFSCCDGVVLAADRQVTVTGYFKDHEAKLTVFSHPHFQLASTYAFLPNLANILNDRIHLELDTVSNPHGEEIVEIITAETNRLRKQYPSEMKNQQFLWGISTKGEKGRLLRISGGIIDEPLWACIGIGDSSLIRYIVSQLTPIPADCLPAKEVSRLAIYIVQQAKAFVDGCGGRTDTAILFDGGDQPIERPEPEGIEKDFESMQVALRGLYTIWTSTEDSETETSKTIGDLERFIKAKRSKPG